MGTAPQIHLMTGKHFALLILGVTLMAGLTVVAISFAPIELAWVMLIAMIIAYLVRWYKP